MSCLLKRETQFVVKKALEDAIVASGEQWASSEDTVSIVNSKELKYYGRHLKFVKNEDKKVFIAQYDDEIKDTVGSYLEKLKPLYKTALERYEEEMRQFIEKEKIEIRRQAAKLGYSVKEQEVDGEIHLSLVKAS